MDRASRLLKVALRHYFPDGKIPPYDLEGVKSELVEMGDVSAEDYSFHLFVTFVPPIIRRMYPDVAEKHHLDATIPLIVEILGANK